MRKALGNARCFWLPLPFLIHATQEPWWPMKSGNSNRSGLSPHVTPFNLSKPSWVFQEKALTEGSVFHNSPIMDGDFNTYIMGTKGWAYSIDKYGKTRWEVYLGFAPLIPMLADGVLYTLNSDGFAIALDAKTGAIRWQVKIGLSGTTDASSCLVVGDIVLYPVTPEHWRPEAHAADYVNPASGTEEIVALSTADGAEKWRYSVVNRSGTIMYNVAPALAGSDVIVSDMSGGLYRLALRDGHEVWYEPGVTFGTWSTGGFAIGPNDMVYVTSIYRRVVACTGNGIVRAHHLGTGKVAWNRTFAQSLNVAPAVGPVGPGGRLAVIVATGQNQSPAPIPWWIYPMVLFLNWRAGDTFPPQSPTVALDAETGDFLWTLDLPSVGWELPGQLGSAGWCAPDVYGTPSVGADGSVYLNWSGGKALAVKDANADGRIDVEDPAELSSFHHGEGSNSQAAMAPGYLVAVSCRRVMGFVGVD